MHVSLKNIRHPRFWRGFALFAVSVVLTVGYMHIYVFVLGWELPRTIALKRENAVLFAKMQVLDRNMSMYEEELSSLQARDEDIYRSVFGLNSIPENVRGGGLRGDSRYEALQEADRVGRVTSLCKKADRLEKKAYVQSRSYDEIELMLQNADEMSTSIPTICPIEINGRKGYISSSFGYRYHPILKYRRMHRGMDFCVPVGSPVVATGDAIVESVKMEIKGYGRQVVLNHGFGYRTRYAHLKTILVGEGMKVSRGQVIALSGNSGISSGPHVHYEVLYRGKNVNPYHYFDKDMPLEQYRDMVKTSEDDIFYIHPMHRKEKKTAKAGTKSKTKPRKR